jgi:hypothetical protein
VFSNLYLSFSFYFILKCSLKVMSSTPRITILFLTNSEYGEANVIIAVSYELLRRGNCDVHIASYSVLSKRIADLENGAFGAIPKETTSITLHPFTGLSMHEVRREKFGINDIHHKPGLKGAIGTFWFDSLRSVD